MRVCPSCGSTNEAYAAQCVVCGGSLEGAPETRRPGQSDLAQTRMGVPSITEQQGAPSQVSSTLPDPGLGERSAGAAPKGPEPNLGGTQLLPPQTPRIPAEAAPAAAPQSAARPGPAPPPQEAAQQGAAAARTPNLLRTQLQYAAPLPEAEAPQTSTAPNETALGKATMLGMPAVSPGTPSPHGSEKPAKGTMLGMPPLQGGPQAPQNGPDLAKGTMLGIAPVNPEQLAAQTEAVRQSQASAGNLPAPPPAAAPASSTAAPQLLSEKRTMLGVAMPGIAPTGNAPPSSVASEKRTMLGVAMPGIAPIHPGQAPATAQPVASPAEAPPQPSAPPQPAGVPQGRAIWPWLLVGFAVLILIGGVALWFVLKPTTPISARLESAKDGKEQLQLSCLACPDQSKVKLESSPAEASFASGRATLQLDQPLSVGDHELALQLTRPGSKPEIVKLQIPVDYRVKVDIAALQEDPPKLALAVEARPGTEVEVEGKAVELDADGKGRWTEDVTQQLTGPAKSVERLERELSYRVTPPGSAAESGTAKVQIGIAPLVVEAPLKSITIAEPRFLLAGTTQPDVEVTVAGRTIKRQPDGSFSQVMNVSTTGETTIQVKGSLEKHAPRYVPIHVKRVASLEDAAKSFRKAKLAGYASVIQQLGKTAGSKVAWAGKVTDARSSEHRNILLLDVSGQCAASPCLARVVYAGDTPIESGDRITVFGEFTRGVPGPRRGQTVPEVDAEFILEGTK
ncbi:MAG: hypothetical protein R3B89_02530 [Polyangiaceae bacterium]